MFFLLIILAKVFSSVAFAASVVGLSIYIRIRLMISVRKWLGVLVILLYRGGVLVIFLFITTFSFNPFLNVGPIFLVFFRSIIFALFGSNIVISKNIGREVGVAILKIWSICFLGGLIYFSIWVINKILLNISQSFRV